MKTPAIITIEHLSKTYRITRKQPGLLASLASLVSTKSEEITAVADVSFSVAPGEFIGLLGPNGAGKTTIIKTLAGILHPSQGNVRVLGYNPTERAPAYLEQISLIMGQKQYIWLDIPPLDSYQVLKEIYNIPDKMYHDRLAELLDLLDLHEVATVQTRRLSLGQRMRAELAGALLHQPKVLFLDEPTIGLDVVAQKRIWEFLKMYQRTNNLTVILTSHYMADIERLCDRVLVISTGKLVYDGTLADLRSRSGLAKRLTVTFDQPVSRQELVSLGQVISLDHSTATLAIATVDIAKTVSRILRRMTITDLTIQEPEAADVIRELFEHLEHHASTNQ